MRQDEPTVGEHRVFHEQQVDVDRPRSVARFTWFPPKVSLDLLARRQQRMRIEGGLGLYDGVVEVPLLGDLPDRLCLVYG